MAKPTASMLLGRAVHGMVDCDIAKTLYSSSYVFLQSETRAQPTNLNGGFIRSSTMSLTALLFC